MPINTYETLVGLELILALCLSSLILRYLCDVCAVILRAQRKHFFQAPRFRYPYRRPWVFMILWHEIRPPSGRSNSFLVLRLFVLSVWLLAVLNMTLLLHFSHGVEGWEIHWDKFPAATHMRHI
ncbi:hypothetical protein BZA05DRAFT_440613 [Tricharina praecox]|uniref:uncharacterized protein n=1 Tax=Tricharina praecox TaxID=43433 RepID=UPI00221FA239|nr:uncharacterized protein BZA05DRAFT_440613 [Tricharina praecox]KAI5859009.1 hypothetical protein BZA05DRAFT_440613 [Tricharina praecox]